MLKKRYHIKVILFETALLIIISLSCNNLVTKQRNNMEFYPQKFSKVPVNTELENLCSPEEPEADWCGILINGPQKIILNHIDEEIFIPICGFYQIETANLLDSKPITLNVMLEGRDEIYSGFSIESSQDLEIPKPQISKLKPEDVKDELSLGYFNPDLLEYVDMPITNGVYKVFVEYGNRKSNIITISLEIK